MSHKKIYKNSSRKLSQKNYTVSYRVYCIPEWQSAFHDVHKVKTGITCFELPKDPALRKKQLQIIERYRRTGRADKFSKTKNSCFVNL